MAQRRTAHKPAASTRSSSKSTKSTVAKKNHSADVAASSAPAKVAPKAKESTFKPKTAVTLSAATRSTSTKTPHHRHNPVVLELRAFGLSYPEAHLKSPWPEHLDLAVRDKTFAYLSIEGEPLRLSCKLPQSCQTALDLAFTKPTGYGLGKSGWVTATFEDDDDPPVEFLKTWLDESYRAQAPKTLTKSLPKMT